MKKTTVIIFTVLLIIVLIVTLKNSISVNIDLKDAGSSNNVSTSPAQSSKNGLETKENTEGPVSIAVTPLDLGDDSPTWNFEVSLNTHSGALDTNLTTASELIGVQGKSYKPVSWDGPAFEGHHLKGILKFKPILPKPKPIELKIKNIGGVSERSFKWNL